MSVSIWNVTVEMSNDAHVADIEEQALEGCELVRGDLQETGVVIGHTAGGSLVCAERICTGMSRELLCDYCRRDADH